MLAGAAAGALALVPAAALSDAPAASDAFARAYAALWDGVAQAHAALSPPKASARRTESIRNVLVSLGGAIFSATAIGISVSVFLIQQNLQRLHFRTFDVVFPRRRVKAFVATNIALAVATYLLAALIRPGNAYAMLAGGMLVAAWFTRAILGFLLSNIALLDPSTVIARTYERFRKDTAGELAAFERALGILAEEVAGRDSRQVIAVGEREEDRAIAAARSIARRADRCVEELIPIVLAHARQRDYANVDRACDAIADACIEAIARIDRIFVLYRETLKINFKERLSFLDTFSRTKQIAHEAVKDADLNLCGTLVAMNARIARSIAPGTDNPVAPGTRLSAANDANATYALLRMRDTAIAEARDELSERSVICLNAYARLADSWTKEFSIFPYVIEKEAGEIALAALPVRGGDFAAERALSCLTVLMRRAQALVDPGRIQKILDGMLDIVAAAAAQYPAGKGAPGHRDFLDVAVSATGGLLGQKQRLFDILDKGRDAHVYRHGDASDTLPDPGWLVAFAGAYLRFLDKAGKALAESAAATHHTDEIVETTIKSLRTCLELRHALAPDAPGRDELRQIVLAKLGSLDDDIRGFATDELRYVFLTYDIVNVALAAAEDADDDVVVAVVRVALQFAGRILADPSAGHEVARYLYAAALLGAVEKSGRGLAAVTEALRGGLSAEHAATHPEACSELRNRLALADEQAFVEQMGPVSLVSHQAKTIVERAGFARVRAVQDEVLAALDAIPSPPAAAPDQRAAAAC